MPVTRSIIKNRRTTNKRTTNKRTTNRRTTNRRTSNTRTTNRRTSNRKTTNKINRKTSIKKLKNIIPKNINGIEIIPRDINGIQIKFKQLENEYRTIMIDEENNEVGEFIVNKLQDKLQDKRNHIGYDLGIHIDEKYLKKGYSKKLIKLMTNNLILKLAKDTKLYIDTDASWEENKEGILTSFWDTIGMKRTLEHDPFFGYEKTITLEDLYKFSHDIEF